MSLTAELYGLFAVSGFSGRTFILWLPLQNIPVSTLHIYKCLCPLLSRGV